MFQVNFVLWSVVTISPPIKQQGVWKRQAAETPTCLPFFLKGENAISQRNWDTNHIASALYRDRSDIIPMLAFSNTACCIQWQSWSINPKCIQLLDKHLTSYYHYFLNLNNAKCWILYGPGTGVTQDGKAKRVCRLSRLLCGCSNSRQCNIFIGCKPHGRISDTIGKPTT